MRSLTVCFIALLPLVLLAKPVEEKSKPLKIDDLQASDVSPTTLPTILQTEITPRKNHPDGEPTFEQEIARVIEGSVENLIPFGASEKSPVVKKESANEEQLKNEGNLTSLSVIDWFGMVLNHELGSQTPQTYEDEPKTTTTEASPSLNTKLDWLQMILNHQRIMGQSQENSMGQQQENSMEQRQRNPMEQGQRNPMEQQQGNPMEQQFNVQREQNRDVVEDVQEQVAPSSIFDSKYQQWQNARNLANQQWIPTEPQKQDQYSAAIKSKTNWSKLLAEPVEDYKQYIPADNTVQWRSGELNSEMIDNAQKQLLIPSTFMKNKEQWFGESEM